jgi:hypothetical protein
VTVLPLPTLTSKWSQRRRAVAEPSSSTNWAPGTRPRLVNSKSERRPGRAPGDYSVGLLTPPARSRTASAYAAHCGLADDSAEGVDPGPKGSYAAF